MTEKSTVKGRLISLEGSGGRSMAMAAKVLERNLRQQKIATAICTWDASDIFFQIAQGARGLPGPPPQTLILLYASDLAFRLRWQIRPALDRRAVRGDGDRLRARGRAAQRMVEIGIRIRAAGRRVLPGSGRHHPG